MSDLEFHMHEHRFVSVRWGTKRLVSSYRGGIHTAFGRAGGEWVRKWSPLPRLESRENFGKFACHVVYFHAYLHVLDSKLGPK
jgi:hypothetical protein